MFIKDYVRLAAVVFASTLTLTSLAMADNKVKPAPNGIHIPDNYRDWKLISVSHRTDHHSMRAILGNEIAIKAARAGETNPWPKGTILAKLVWKEAVDENWSAAIVPREFIHAEFMFKDANKYASTGGWGYARWLGKEQKPYGETADFAQECVGCHTPVKDRDWVFTHPVTLP